MTGGSGFLGQHIVKHLQEFDNDVKEIRIIDLKPYANNLGKCYASAAGFKYYSAHTAQVHTLV